MLRLVAELDGDDGDAGIPKGVVEKVKEMRMGTGRYMFRVCFVLVLRVPWYRVAVTDWGLGCHRRDTTSSSN